MRVNVDFNELGKALTFANTVLGDKSVPDSAKNFIFKVSKDKMTVIGYSSFIFSKTEMENWSIEDVDDSEENEWSFQLKASELNKIMASFSSLSRTMVESMYFFHEGLRIGVNVHEEPLEGGDAKLAQDSRFFLETSSIPNKINAEIETEITEEGEILSEGDLLLYIGTLLPIMNNDSSNSSSSKLNFADDYVFALTTGMSAFMPNKLPDALKDLSLTYSSVSFLKKLSESSDTGIEIAKTDKYICVKAGNTQAFMKYQRIKISYQMYLNKFSKETGVSMDRLYLKDVLKRLGNLATDAKVSILEDSIQVENVNFHQLIPLNKFKGEYEGISFTIPISSFEKVLLGSDDIFSEDIFLYFVKSTRGYVLYVTDSTGAWLSSMSVNNK